MRKYVRVCFSFDEKTINQLDKFSNNAGMSKSEFLKQLLSVLDDPVRTHYFLQLIRKGSSSTK